MGNNNLLVPPRLANQEPEIDVSSFGYKMQKEINDMANLTCEAVEAIRDDASEPLFRRFAAKRVIADFAKIG